MHKVHFTHTMDGIESTLTCCSCDARLTGHCKGLYKQEVVFALWDFCVEVAEAAFVNWLAVLLSKKTQFGLILVT